MLLGGVEERFDKSIRYENICIVHTVYALLQYLLLVNRDDYQKTLFFIGLDAIAPEVYNNLPNVVLFDDSKFKSIKRTFWMRLYVFLYYRKVISTAKIYCQDHLYFPSIVVGRKSYVLLEDGSQIYSRYKTGPLANIDKCNTLIEKFVRAPMYGRTLGRNSQCEKIYYTFIGDSRSDIVLSHNSERIDLNELWNTLPSEQKESINAIYGVDEKLLERIHQSNVIILTDSAVTGGVITEQEQLEIYKPYVEANNGNVVIKKHPVDCTNYTKYFPNATICEGFIPMQLLSMNKCSFKFAITLFSTSVSLLDKNTEIIWLGNAGNEKLRKYYGECPNPFVSKKCNSN